MKRYGIYRRKVSWILKRYRKCGTKVFELWNDMENTEQNCEMILKIWQKGKLKCEKIWIIWKTGKSNSDKVWTIWKKSKLNNEKIWNMKNMEETQVE